MRQYSTRSMILAVALALATSAAAIAAPATKPGRNHFMLYGRVLKVDQGARTLLVADRHSEKLYLVGMPKGTTVKISFGANAALSSAEFKDVQKNNRIIARVKRASEDRLARIEDGRQVIAVTLAQ